MTNGISSTTLPIMTMLLTLAVAGPAEAGALAAIDQAPMPATKRRPATELQANGYNIIPSGICTDLHTYPNTMCGRQRTPEVNKKLIPVATAENQYCGWLPTSLFGWCAQVVQRVRKFAD